MSIAFARRYRPRRFADLVVQDHVSAALRGAILKDRVGHGYLLTGPRGVGKTTAARILAMALNCQNRGADGEPCGECSSCLKIWNGSVDIDVVEIDAASNRGVEDARGLRESAMYAASQAGHHKVYIIDEAHMLTREAWNVLLKILEEPPPGVVFVFATTEPQKIANTAAPVMSRLQRFDFRRIGPAAIHGRLREVLAAEHLEAEDDALLLIARQADGGMRDALSVLDQCLSFGEGVLTAARVRETLGLMDDESYGELLAAVADQDPATVFAVMRRVADSGADLAEFSGGIAEMLRAVIMHHFGTAPEGIPESTRAVVATIALRLAAEDAVRMLKLLGDAEANIRRSANPRIALETLLLRWTLMERAVDLRAVLEKPAQKQLAQRHAASAQESEGALPKSPPSEGALPKSPPPEGTLPKSPPSEGALPKSPPPEGTLPKSPPSEGALPKSPPSEGALPKSPPSEGALPKSPPPEGTLPKSPAAKRSEEKSDEEPDLIALWPEVIATSTRQSPLLGQAVARAQPSFGEGGAVLLTFGADSGLFQDGIARQLGTLETIVGAALGRPTTIRIQAAQADAPRPRRLTNEDRRAERLAQLRTRDPALDAAANALDLELVDDG